MQDTTKEIQERNDIEAIAFDFIQNLQLSVVSVQELFYLIQLSVKVFCVHDLKQGKHIFIFTMRVLLLRGLIKYAVS